MTQPEPTTPEPQPEDETVEPLPDVDDTDLPDGTDRSPDRPA